MEKRREGSESPSRTIKSEKDEIHTLKLYFWHFSNIEHGSRSGTFRGIAFGEDGEGGLQWRIRGEELWGDYLFPLLGLIF